MERPRVAAVAGGGGLALLVGGGLLIWLGTSAHHSVATVFGILAGVLGLVGLRVRWWIRRERLMRRLGESFHVPEE
jgi:Flp pilus assembly protein TadB